MERMIVDSGTPARDISRTSALVSGLGCLPVCAKAPSARTRSGIPRFMAQILVQFCVIRSHRDSRMCRGGKNRSSECALHQSARATCESPGKSRCSFDDVLVLDRPQHLTTLGRRDVLVVRRQQSVVLNGIVFTAGPARLCAIECPITPGKIILLHVADIHYEPIRVGPAV